MKYKYDFELSVIDGAEMDDGRIILNSLQTYGDTLEECINNATVGLVTWHGNEAGYTGIGDLSDKLFNKAYKAIEEYVTQSQN